MPNEILVWGLILLVSLALLVKSADWLVESAEHIGLSFGISPFIIGITIVAIGTSMPELVAAFVAVFKGVPEIVVANAVGSNLTNIFLIIGLSAVAARVLVVKRSLIDIDLPLLSVATALFLFVAWDRTVTMGEGVLLTATFLVYFVYTVVHRREESSDDQDVLPLATSPNTLPSRADRRHAEAVAYQERATWKHILLLVAGIIGLAIGSNYVVDAVVHLSRELEIATSFIAITVVALGTSLPELVVSVRAAFAKKYEVALGNIFGSNVFNVLAVVGIPALVAPLVIDDLTFMVGLPFLIAASVLFVISGISKKVYIWEGLMFLLLYVLFLMQLWEFSV